MKKLSIFCFFHVLLCSSSLVFSASDGGLDIYSRLIAGLRLDELAKITFLNSYMKSCTAVASEEACKRSEPHIKQDEIAARYVSVLQKTYQPEEITPIVKFLESDNGKIFSNVSYAQNAKGSVFEVPEPYFSPLQEQQIQAFLDGSEWRVFQSKMGAMDLAPVMEYVFAQSRKSLDELMSKLKPDHR